MNNINKSTINAIIEIDKLMGFDFAREMFLKILKSYNDGKISLSVKYENEFNMLCCRYN